MISETKIDDTFPVGNILMDRFSSLYRLGRDSMGGRIVLYVRDDIPSNLLSIEMKPTEKFYVELNLRNNKWFINCSDNPHNNMIGNHLRALSENLHSSNYDKFIIL